MAVEKMALSEKVKNMTALIVSDRESAYKCFQMLSERHW